jgi:hypothetical protein
VDDDQLIGMLVKWQQTEAWAASGKLSAVAELIRRRPGDCPPAPAEAAAGLLRREWGKFCGDELAVATATSKVAAEKTLGLAYDLAARLPGTCRALREGVIDSYKAQIIADATRILDDAGAAAAEALILPTVAGKTPGQIRVAAGRAVASVDPEAARLRRERAQRDARVELWREDAGTAALCGYGLPPDAALAADQAISARAMELKAAGLAGTMDQLRVRAYLDFLLGQDTLGGLQAGTQPAARDDATDDDHAGRAGNDSDRPGPASAGTDQAGDGRDGADQPGPSPQDAGQPDRSADGGARGRDAADSTGTAGGTPARPGRPAGFPARLNLTIPLATLLGLADRPGEAAGFGALEPDLARALAAMAAGHPGTTWCVTVTDQDGHPAGHGCAHRTPRGPANSPSPGPPGNMHGPPGNMHGPPGNDPGPPGHDSGPPGSNPGRPVDEHGPPGHDPGQPVNDSSLPGNDPTLPGNDPTLPVDDPGRPGQDSGRPSAAGFTQGPGAGPPGGYGSWRLRAGPDGPPLTIDIEPVPVTDCDHRHETGAYEPSDRLRHLVQIRDGECTWPPCRRNARRCDFEHAVPYDQGGRTCACNAGARCRHHHHQKQAAGWCLDQNQPGYHTWTTPSGRTYTTGPTTYPV